jgi:hypothetical protein
MQLYKQPTPFNSDQKESSPVKDRPKTTREQIWDILKLLVGQSVHTSNDDDSLNKNYQETNEFCEHCNKPVNDDNRVICECIDMKTACSSECLRKLH